MIDDAEEARGIGPDAILLHVAVAVAPHRGVAYRPVGAERGVAFDIAVQRVVERTRDFRCQVDLVEVIAIAFEQAGGMAAQSQHLETVGRLHDAHQWLGVEAVGDDRQLGHWTLQLVGPKESRCNQHGQAIERVVPEIEVGGQRVQRLKQRRDFAIRILLLQR